MIDSQVLSAVKQAFVLADTEPQIVQRTPLAIQSNALYDVHVGDRHYIAKHYLKPDELTVAPAREFGALQRLAPYDIAPQPVFYDPQIGPVVLYEYLPGAMWDRQRPSPHQLEALAQLWLTVNRLPTSGLWLSRGWERSLREHFATFTAQFDEYAMWSTVHFPAGGAAIALCQERLARTQPIIAHIDHAQPILCFCRSDPRFANVIERPDGRPAYVDWEDSGLRDPARDVADLLMHPNQEDLLDHTEWQPFLQTYLAERRSVDLGIDERIHHYLALFPLFWLAVGMRIGLRRARMGTLAGWQINEMPANDRLRRYLARALAWPQQNLTAIWPTVADLQFFPTIDNRPASDEL